VDIATGRSHTCAATKDGSVYCWGCGDGVVGDGGNTVQYSPVQVKGVKANRLSAKQDHVCATGEDGRAWCWGKNDHHQSASESLLYSSLAREVPKLNGIIALTSGLAHSCAVDKDAQAWCWGGNSWGQLGRGHNLVSESPDKVLGLRDTQHIEVGQAHSCAIRGDGEVLCWGLNTHSQVNPTKARGDWFSPSVVSGKKGATRLFLGSRYSCALGDEMSCWGGQLRTIPEDTADISGVCFREKKMVKCVRGRGVKDIPELKDVSQMAFGAGLNCALFQNGDLRCGRFPEALDTIHQDLKGSKEVQVGHGFGCALMENDTIQCWGSNDLGQLGDGTQVTRATPAVVRGLEGVIEMSVGADFACALLSNAKVNCWGSNRSGQLGLGAGAIQAFPKEIHWSRNP